jgi:hypothetical protein
LNSSQAVKEVAQIAAAHAEKVDAAGVFPEEAVAALWLFTEQWAVAATKAALFPCA